MAKDVIGGRCVLIASQMARYPRAAAPRLRQCIQLSERLAQLSMSHPVLLYALAMEYGPPERRREAVRRAVAGYPLRDVCAVLRLPMCWRRIAPESCPPHIWYVPWDAHVSRRLGSLIPKNANGAARWLQAVSLCGAACDQEFAIWIAQQRTLYRTVWPGAETLLPLALYAWHSKSDHAPAHLRPIVPWSSTFSMRSVIGWAGFWFRQVRLYAEMSSSSSDPWIEEMRWLGYEFVPLMTPEALLDEARTMCNCADNYGSGIAGGSCRLFSMRKDGRRIATLEIRPETENDRYFLAQIKGPANAEVAYEHRQAARLWVAVARQRPDAEERYVGETEADAGLREMLQPWAKERGAQGEAWLAGMSRLGLAMHLMHLNAKFGRPPLQL